MLRESKTYKRMMPLLLGVPEFKNIVLRTGKTAEQSRGDILVGKASHQPSSVRGESWKLNDARTTFNLLYQLIAEAIDHGEDVSMEVLSAKEWTYR